MIVKVLTLRQPWAELVVMGAKRFETRSWDTKYRGPLLIHSSAKMTKQEAALAQAWPFSEYITNLEELEQGYILGAVDLFKTTCTRECYNRYLAAETERNAQEYHFGDYSEGRFAWHLRNAIQFNEIIPAKGRLGLWDYEIEHPLIKEVCHA